MGVVTVDSAIQGGCKTCRFIVYYLPYLRCQNPKEMSRKKIRKIKIRKTIYFKSYLSEDRNFHL